MKAESKFSERAFKAVLVGSSSTGQILWHPNTGGFIESRHVLFNKKLVYQDSFKNVARAAESLLELERRENVDAETWFKEFKEDEELEVKRNDAKQSNKRRGRPHKRKLESGKVEEPPVKRRK